MHIPTDIDVIYKIEQEVDVVQTFKYRDSTAWLSIKNLLTLSFYSKDIRVKTGTSKDIFTMRGLKIAWMSMGFLLLNIRSKKKKSIFLGASTGLFTYDDKVLDAYFPYYDLSTDDVIYMLNCANLTQLYEHISYVDQKHIVIENYLLGIFKTLLAKVLYLLNRTKVKRFDAFKSELEVRGIDMASSSINKSYYSFIAGYHVYRSIFRYLNIDKAYIISPATKSDMCAALKSLDIDIIEVQHGVAGKMHRGYNHAFAANEDVPTPDRIDVYNEFWRDEIVSAGYFHKENIKIVGRLKYDIVEDIDTFGKDEYIIFTGQGAYLEEVVEFFLDSAEAVRQHGLKMIYKPHPRELKSEIDYFDSKVASSDVLQIYKGDLTTEALIKNSRAHISIFSSCHFDAVYFKSKTYILDIMSNSIMHYYSANHPERFITIRSVGEALEDLGR